MGREGFRKQLRQEAQQWQAEQLISEEQYARLSDRYQFEALATTSQLFSMVLYGLGGILVGLAVITFVAANWQALDKPTKLLLLLGSLSGANILGFYLWQKVPGFWRLGQGLLLLGGLILGANMALVAQMFHLDGNLSSLYFGWGMGVLAMSACLRFQPLSVMALLLVGIGFLRYQTETYSLASAGDWWGPAMPIVAILLLPLSYSLDSRATFTCTVLLWMLSTSFDLWRVNPIFSLLIPFCLLWAYNDGLQLDRLGSGLTQRQFQPIARVIALLFLAGDFYIYSFRFIWRDNAATALENVSLLNQGYLVLFAALSVYAVIRQVLFLPGRREAMGKILLAMVGVFWTARFTASPIVGVFITNCLLALLSLGLIRGGIEQGKRQNFWFGLVLLTLLITSRLFEYNTGLLLKALTFALCGFAILGLGQWFERHLQKLTPSPGAQP